MARYARSGARRGKYKGMALFGGILLMFAVIGVIATSIWSFNRVTDIVTDDTALRELDTLLEPVVMLDPEPFDSVDKIPNEVILESSVWAATLSDRDGTKYKTDEAGRMLIPEAEVTAQANRLFAAGTEFTLESFGSEESTVQYDEDAKTFHVPIMGLDAYTPYVTKLRKKRSVTIATVGYIPSGESWAQDKDGNLIPPIPSKYMIYELEGRRGSYRIMAVKEAPQEDLLTSTPKK